MVRTLMEATIGCTNTGWSPMLTATQPPKNEHTQRTSNNSLMRTKDIGTTQVKP